MIQIWRLTPIQNIKLEVDGSSLDAITRQLPDGYYSTFRTYGGCRRVLGLATHLRRLYGPISNPEVNAPSLRRQLRALLEPYRPDEGRVRVVMTKKGEAYIAIEPLKELPGEIYKKGVRVETTDLHREHPRLKSTTFIGRSDPERKHIAREGIFEALLVKDGKILEGMTSNFFYVLRAERSEERLLRRAKSTLAPTARIGEHAQSEKVLCTAKDHILLGVTRKTVIKIARGRGLQVKYKPLKRDQLPAVAEAFITSSSRGIVPVIQIDDVSVGQGRPGLITEELMGAYETYILEKAEMI